MSNSNGHKPGYKHTPFGWVPEEWEIREFADVTSKILDGTHFSPKSKNGHYKYITSKNIRNEGLDLTEVEYISEEEHKEIYKRCPVSFNDILLTKDGAGTGNCCMNTLHEEFSLLSSVAVLRGKEDICDNGFLYQFIRSPRGQYIIKDAIAGQAITRITLEKIRRFDILIPSLFEQRKIATILSTWDEAINKTQQLSKCLQQRYKGLMQQLLKPKDNWIENKLSDIFERVTRRNLTGNHNVVTISAQRGFVKQNDFFKKIVASETLDNYFLVRKGEFCYNKSYSTGYDWGAIKRLNDFNEAVVTTLYICFGIRDESKYFSDFFEFFFDACLLDDSLSKIAHEGGRAHGLLNVTPSDFFNLNVLVPSFEKQKEICRVLSAAKAEIKLTKQRLSTLQLQKKGLMQKLMTGEVRIKF